MNPETARNSAQQRELANCSSFSKSILQDFLSILLRCFHVFKMMLKCRVHVCLQTSNQLHIEAVPIVTLSCLLCGQGILLQKNGQYPTTIRLAFAMCAQVLYIALANSMNFSSVTEARREGCPVVGSSGRPVMSSIVIWVHALFCQSQFIQQFNNCWGP